MTDRVTLLREAQALEAMGGDWEIQHVVAFCGVSETTIRRSQMERIEREGARGVKGKPMIYFKPAAVRAWNEKRTRKTEAA